MDQVKASISSGYRWRLVLITVLMLGFAAYCFYDWRVAYPRTKEIGLAFQQLKAQDELTYLQRWTGVAAERGWPTDVPAKIKSEAEYDSDILAQLIMLVITGSIGLYFLSKLIVESRRWVAMDDQGLAATGGKRIPWSTITGLDETRWKTKGIAYVLYDSPPGSTKRLLLDDFKAEREPVKTIVHAVQARLNLATEPAPGTAPGTVPGPEAVAEG